MSVSDQLGQGCVNFLKRQTLANDPGREGQHLVRVQSQLRGKGRTHIQRILMTDLTGSGIRAFGVNQPSPGLARQMSARHMNRRCAKGILSKHAGHGDFRTEDKGRHVVAVTAV